MVLSAADDPYSVRAAFVAGAQGYLLKTASPVVVADGVRQVLVRWRVRRPVRRLAARRRAAHRRSRREPASPTCPAARSRSSSLVCDGKSNKEIGDLLGLSALTVKSHLARIARKLGTGDRAEMVALAMRAGRHPLSSPAPAGRDHQSPTDETNAGETAGGDRRGHRR